MKLYFRVGSAAARQLKAFSSPQSSRKSMISSLAGSRQWEGLLLDPAVWRVGPGAAQNGGVSLTSSYKSFLLSSTRVLRPPGGASNISFGTEDESTPRKNKMASNIFAGPDDPHAHRRNNPPSKLPFFLFFCLPSQFKQYVVQLVLVSRSPAGAPQGTLCGEPSAPLRRCQQPLLFPKNPEPELTTIHNSGAALAWNQRREGENGKDQASEDCPDDVEGESEEQKERPQPPAPSGGANTNPGAANGGRRNPPGGKSSLILG
ncbi:Jupiter microtubule associated 1 [Merluccius polli]|uniref:Jupiter microtubule associated 1 n=1 Tax=Merluccius polli TaxID=89951 RepID=A0AA47M3W9_MERPO|nr:Jupiter microtubule associated 1 [Merluccius polli]